MGECGQRVRLTAEDRGGDDDLRRLRGFPESRGNDPAADGVDSYKEP